jgi:hypothetical protein
MKSRGLSCIVVLLSLGAGITLRAQTISAMDSTEIPGDNFSLEGALELFREAGSPEEFEKLLNAEDRRVNNLDLNGDGEIDYVRVIDKVDGMAHALILQAVISDTESQDIAVIELEKKGNDNAVIQIVGDEDIYGVETIVEPTSESAPAKTSTAVGVNVWGWPAVRYVYGPSYVLWASPWTWRLRPVWWRPWRPLHRSVFFAYRAPYRQRYAVVHTHRVVAARRIYAPVRTTSVIVHDRHHATVTRYRTSRTVRTTTVRTRNGPVKTRTTRTKRGVR